MLRLGEDGASGGAAADADSSEQCHDPDGPYYVNAAAALAAERAAAGNDDDDDDDGDGDDGLSSGDYMHVVDSVADEDVDNVYLSLLDIVSIEQRQIQVNRFI